MAGRIEILHVVGSYLPNAVGGMEIHIQTLIVGLAAHGMRCAVAIPSEGEPYDHRGVPVFPLARGSASGLAHAYGEPNEETARSFQVLIGALKPGIVHLHSHTAEISELLIDAARDIGAKTVLSFHIPGVSCARGTMLYMGEAPCDGRLDVGRCAACVIAACGRSRAASRAVASLPQAVARAISGAGLARGPLAGLHLLPLMAARIDRFHSAARKLDRIVAVSAWVADVLRMNGVPESKIVLCRYGAVTTPRPAARREGGGPLRLKYFGRLVGVKGIGIVIDALRQMPNADVRFDIHGVRNAVAEREVAGLMALAAGDERIALHPPVPHDEVIDAMRACDFVVVPSRWLETGPLVALEAFAAGTPVLGSRIGGLPELVTSGVDGVLIAPNTPEAWAAEISALARDPACVAALRAGVRPPRTTEDVAREMAALYDSLR
jgi:glycosyltransferase involved in cell wall biosynthesis